ncbi:unnamed protein product [Rotaria magnacalcarata]|uniref:Uncharacterized protein n=1 Tax=Rotaria magnacalcarata TaxID=392030 RepID=A0A816V5X6_9BILA|nr:unnamed protein product [Rotaria magnacalcarata]CAF2120266.1 unnamed protein product [Rotaria magnacalcarata]
MEDDAISSASKRITEINRMLQNGIQDIENLAKEHANDGDIDKYEIMLDEKSEQLKKSLSNEIESLKQSIRVYRPQKSDSIEKQRNYVQLNENCISGLNDTTSKVSRIFSRIGKVIKDICQAIIKKTPQILMFISKIFIMFIVPLL